jgi:hypothetical protein
MNKFKLLESLEDIVGQLQMGKVSFDVAVDTLDNIVTYNKKQSFMVRIDYLEGYEDTTSKHFSLNELEEFMDEEDLEVVLDLKVGKGIQINGVTDKVWVERVAYFDPFELEYRGDTYGTD